MAFFFFFFSPGQRAPRGAARVRRGDCRSAPHRGARSDSLGRTERTDPIESTGGVHAPPHPRRWCRTGGKAIPVIFFRAPSAHRAHERPPRNRRQFNSFRVRRPHSALTSPARRGVVLRVVLRRGDPPSAARDLWIPLEGRAPGGLNAAAARPCRSARVR